MYKSLNAPAIGIKGKTLAEVAALARATGFAGIDFDIRAARALAEAQSPGALRDALDSVLPGQFGLPVEGPQTEWQVDLDALAADAALARAVGCTRCATWVPSWSDSRAPDENTAFHIARLRPVAAVLADHGIALGLEFLGPKSLLAGHAHAFLRSMDSMLDMAREIGPNTGLLLDIWHLFTSGGTLADMARLSARDIVHVHINDAPPGVDFDTAPDTVRCLPLETGVLDLAGFMRSLKAAGYDGPVVTEPFNARLNALAATDPPAAAREVSAAMDRLWKMSGL